MKKEDKFFVQSVNRTLEIVDVIGNAKCQGICITEISKEVDLPVSTVYRLVQNLVAWNYAQENPDGNYTLGLKLLELGSKVQKNLEIRNIARKYMEELNDSTKETIYLAILDEKEQNLLYIEKVESQRNVTLAAGIGTRNFIHSTANGKCLVSSFSDDKIRKILSEKGTPALTQYTITDAGKFLEEVHKVRDLGYAIDDLENEGSVRCVAAPVYDYRNAVVASLSISGVATNIDPEIMHGQYRELAIETAKKISKELGYRG